MNRPYPFHDTAKRGILLLLLLFPISLLSAQGWGSWENGSLLERVYLPAGLSLRLHLLERRAFDAPLLSNLFFERERKGLSVRPGIHTAEGSYDSLEIRWEGLHLLLECASRDELLAVKITPLERPIRSSAAVLQLGMVWNRPGWVGRKDSALLAETEGRRWTFSASAPAEEEPFLGLTGPFLAFSLDQQPLVITGGSSAPTPPEGERLIWENKERALREAAAYGELAPAYSAIQSVLGWNRIYDPKNGRLLSTVGRLWNKEYGGYALFGWDNFFLPLLSALVDPGRAWDDLREHLKDRTEEGFFPNDSAGNGRKSLDRSQPPVGGIALRELFKALPDRKALEESFPLLLKWNRWWPKRRLNKGLLSYGSHPAPNPWEDRAAGTAVGAGYESGTDDSPIYEGVPYNPQTHLLELQDVGLTSLYIADCRALEELALILGRKGEAQELRRRGRLFRKALEGLWDEESGLYLNRRSDTGERVKRLTPTLFFPLLAGIPEAHARRMVREHLLNPREFAIPYPLPSVSADDPAFPKQRYWKGAVWPPLNYLVWLGLREAGFSGEAKDLAESSLRLFLGEWNRKGWVCENYSALTGTCDDPRLSSDPFHSWGGLLALPAFAEKTSKHQAR